MSAEATSRDRFVVDTGPLRDIIQTFVTDWRRDRINDGVRFTQASGGAAARARWQGEEPTSVTASAECPPVRPFEYLAAESGVPEWRIRKIAQARRPTTELHIADALIAVIGHPEWLHDGTLEVHPNPRAAKP